MNGMSDGMKRIAGKILGKAHNRFNLRKQPPCPGFKAPRERLESLGPSRNNPPDEVTL